MSRYSSAGAGGRQLLNLKGRLSTESDPEQIRALRRKEIRLLLSMGQRDEAAVRAHAMVTDYPEWPEAHSLKADVLCRRRDWHGAGEEFGRAAELHLKAGETAKAARLMHGPLFRQAETESRFERCMELAMLPGFRVPVLEWRARRLAGQLADRPSCPGDDYPWGALMLLEDAWRGGSAKELLGIVDDWPGSEPEWRWRVLVEGVRIWLRQDLDIRRWEKLLRKTERPVLDPRFDSEARWLDTMKNNLEDGSRR
jgi:hypothetical protein